MSTPAVGANSQLVVAKEAVYGTPPAVGTGKILGLNSFGLKKSANKIQNPQLARDPNYRHSLTGRITHEGPYTSVLNFDSLPLIMEWLTGNRATTGTTPNFLHTSKILDNAPQSRSCELTLDVNGTDHFIMHKGVQVQSFRVVAGGEGYVTADLGLAGKTSTDSATVYFTSPVDLSEGSPLDHAMIGAADVQLNGATFNGMVDLTLEVAPELNLNDYRANGQNVRDNVSRGKVKVSGTLNAMFDALTFYNICTADTPVALSVRLFKDTSTYFKITLPLVAFPPTDPVVHDGGPIPFSSEFMAEYDSVSGTSLTLECANQRPGTDY